MNIRLFPSEFTPQHPFRPRRVNSSSLQRQWRLVLVLVGAEKAPLLARHFGFSAFGPEHPHDTCPSYWLL